MKCGLVALAIGLSAVQCMGNPDANYGAAQKQHSYQSYQNNNNKYNYDHQTYQSGGNMYQTGNQGYDSYKAYQGPAYQTPFAQETSSYGHHNNYIQPAYPDRIAPYPYIEFPKSVEHTKMELAPISEYHCFLSQAPWSSCGRKSLQSYFLQQCITFYYLLSENVDGICGGAPPKPIPEADYYRPHVAEQVQYDSYGNRIQIAGPTSEYVATAAPYIQKPTPAPSGGYSDGVISEYQKERCLQKAYASITTAVLACLTENIIRVKFIEHYSSHARQNPIEGPMLYLKKMHVFIKKVISCTKTKTVFSSYPNLWMTFRNSDGKISYNPNSPFFVDENDNRIGLQQYAHGEAAGLTQFTVGNNGEHFLCSNPSYLDNALVPGVGYYKKDISNPHYSIDTINACNTRSKTYLGIDNRGQSRVLKMCQSTSNNQFISDQSLHSLYHSVSFVQRGTSVLTRPQTIAEVAVRMSGVFQQPILEGFGIFYYCAFYACKANTHGEIDGHCLPKYEDCDSEWRIPSEVTSWSEIHSLSDKVNTCLSNRHITSKEIAENAKVKQYNSNIRRSYICMAEPHIVNFLKTVDNKDAIIDDAMGLVYLQHLATERCYEKSKGYCPSKKSLYKDLRDALEAIAKICEKKNGYSYGNYGSYGNSQYGYGNNQYGYTQYGNNQYQYPQYPTSEYQQNSYGNNQYPQNSYGNNYYPTSQYPQNSYGSNQYPQSEYSPGIRSEYPSRPNSEYYVHQFSAERYRRPRRFPRNRDSNDVPVPGVEPNQPVLVPAPDQPVLVPAPDQPVLVPAPDQPVPAPAPDQPVPVPAPDQPVPAPAPDQPVPVPAPDQPVPVPAPDQPVPVPAPDQPVPAPAPDQPVPAPAPDQPVPAPAPDQPVPAPDQPVPAPKEGPTEPKQKDGPKEPKQKDGPKEPKQKDGPKVPKQKDGNDGPKVPKQKDGNDGPKGFNIEETEAPKENNINEAKEPKENNINEAKEPKETDINGPKEAKEKDNSGPKEAKEKDNSGPKEAKENNIGEAKEGARMDNGQTSDATLDDAERRSGKSMS